MDVPSSKPAPPQAMAASTMIGDHVVNREGKEVGTIHELMIDLDSGRVTYAVLKFGGFLGMGEKLFAVPWPSLSVDLDRERFVLDVDVDKLKSAPGFDKSDWPNMGDRYWGTEIHKFYGRKPYWE